MPIELSGGFGTNPQYDCRLFVAKCYDNCNDYSVVFVTFSHDFS